MTFASTDTAASVPDDYTFTADDAGMHLFSAEATLFTAGSQDLTATDTDSGITGTGTVVVTPATADHFQILAPAQAASGTAFDVTVVALDPYGNVDVNHQATIHFRSTDPGVGVVLPDDYTFTGDDQGMHTFAAGVTLITARDQTLAVMDVDSGILSSAVVTVTDAGVAGSVLHAAATSASGVSEGDPTSPRLAIVHARERPATAPAVAIAAFFHQMRRHRSPVWWMNDELLP